MFQRLLGAFRQRIILLRQRFTAEVEQGQSRIVAAEANPDSMKVAGFSDNRDSAATTGRRLLVYLFDQAALNQLAGNFGDAGGGELAEFGNLNARYRPLLINQPVNRCAIKLLNKIDISYL